MMALILLGSISLGFGQICFFHTKRHLRAKIIEPAWGWLALFLVGPRRIDGKDTQPKKRTFRYRKIALPGVRKTKYLPVLHPVLTSRLNFDRQRTSTTSTAGANHKINYGKQFIDFHNMQIPAVAKNSQILEVHTGNPQDSRLQC